MKIPVRFKRVAAAFEEVARVRSCESSGSEHSADDLSDLVNSFLEREAREQRRGEVDQRNHGNEIDGDDEPGSNSLDFDSRVSLESLFDPENDAVKRSIHAEVEAAYVEVAGEGFASSSSRDFKRWLMSRLRSRGLDAGLCKSKWEKSGLCPPGEYEYVDVNAGGSRYVAEAFLAGAFTIARPTDGYASLLGVFPLIYVGKADELKKVVKIMCRAIKRSMESAGIDVPPWRRRTYMQTKWFGSYKRTTNEIASRKAGKSGDGGLSEKQMVGFVPIQGISLSCRREIAVGKGVRTGNLAVILNKKEMLP